MIASQFCFKAKLTAKKKKLKEVVTLSVSRYCVQVIFGIVILDISREMSKELASDLEKLVSGRLVVWRDCIKSINKKLFRGSDEVEGIYNDKGGHTSY